MPDSVPPVMYLPLMVLGGTVGWYITPILIARIGLRLTALSYACFFLLMAAYQVLSGNHILASLFSAVTLIHVWVWWHSGGGSGTRRRLRSLATRFRPIHCTGNRRPEMRIFFLGLLLGALSGGGSYLLGSGGQLAVIIAVVATITTWACTALIVLVED